MKAWRTTVALAVLLAVSGCAGTTPASDRAVARHTVNNDRSSAPARMVTDEAASYYPADSWSGIAKTGGSFTIYRVPGSDTRSIDNRLRSDFPDVALTFADAKHPAAVLDDLTQRILADSDYWNDQGIDLTSVGPTVDGSGVSVTVSALNGGLETSLQERYAFADITVTRETVTPADS